MIFSRLLGRLVAEGKGVKSRLVEYCQIQAVGGADQRLLAAQKRMGVGVRDAA